jgi:hypothetical protein
MRMNDDYKERELKSTKVLVEISAEFNKQLENELADQRSNYVKITKAQLIIKLALKGFNQ